MVTYILIALAYVVLGVGVVLYYRRQQRRPLDERQGEILAAFTIALLVCSIPLTLILLQQNKIKRQQIAIQSQRAEAVRLVCDLNGVMVMVLDLNPEARGGAAAKVRLGKQRCERLIDDINATRRP